jgi:phosphoglycolate phosphatase-like HAD superfamily hydrolase
MPAAMTTALLDLDGPILDVSPRHHRVYADGVRRLGGEPLDLGTFWAAKRDKISDHEILSRSGLPAAAEAYQGIKRETIEATYYLRLDRLQPGARDILYRLAERHSLVLVTLRHARRELLHQLAALEIASLFTHILSAPAGAAPGWQVKRDLVLEAGLALGPGAFIVGDTETEIHAGRELAVSTVAVCNGIRDERHLQPLAPDWLVPTLADLPAALL